MRCGAISYRVPRVSGNTDDQNVLPRLGAVIRAGRKTAGFSQEAFADASGIDRSHMGKIERGERNITLLNLVRIAQTLNCRLSEILAKADL
ncbi:XRE family transcriptional regulator [Sphingobium yanoikuyae]|uniref:XRE family transcriptional regulator n=1 Tax=Sphingobium yanoikuyae TaxID=13690 RepID=A0A084E6U7_SPHYA|nr:XRE family transcriptional regulator [Sphingobium yanoikuyae]